MVETLPAILVVEDDDAVRDTIIEILRDTGFRVEVATTGWEALEVIAKHRFDMVIADIGLPGGLDGLQMTQHARARYPALRCLFISGQAEPVICDPELDDFVAKPFRPFELLGCVLKVLQGNRPPSRVAIAP